MAGRFLQFPFRLAPQGGAAWIDDADRHLRDKVEALLFTSPGERVNRPDFGAGLARAVFDGVSDLGAAALEFQVSRALRRDLGDEVIVDAVRVEAAPEDGALVLHLTFRRADDLARRALEVRL